MKSIFCIAISFVITFALFANGVQSTIVLNENNWNNMLKGEWMVEFFAPWCPACKNLAPTWEKFGKSAGNFNVKVATIDVTTSPSLSGRFFVTALPTIYHVIDGEFRQYRGPRDIDALTTFVQKKDWKKLEALSAWKKPDTLHMTVLSYFFKLSHVLKEFNGRLQEEYGLPSWGSYALFAIGTIFVGAVLGLLLICIVDFLFPPKKTSRQSFSEARENSKNAVEDLANDEIEDDQQDEAEADNKGNDDEGEDEDEEDESAEDDESEENKKDAGDESTSEEEKNSHSESEQPESDKKDKPSPKQSSPGEVRKRKPRKAD